MIPESNIRIFFNSEMLVRILTPILDDQKHQLCPQSVFSRYSNLFPYDSSRVVVQGSDSDYLNASWLSVAGVGHRMILVMGPLHPDYHGQDTVAAFWRMVQQQEVRQVVMLCQVEILLLPSG